MPGAQPRRSSAQRLASSVTRRASSPAGAPGVAAVRKSQEGGPSSSGQIWVEVEAEADIAAKGHPYISFDPAGTYP